MGKLYYLIGKSSTGKDTIFNALLEDRDLGLQKIIQYSTRPIRDHETEGVQYHFIDETRRKALEEAGKIIEQRDYHTVHGLWSYMMVDDGAVDLSGSQDYIAVGTAESFQKVRDYFGEERVIPIQIEVETGERLYRAILRERNSNNPKYAEMCRRFLADEADFSDENLKKAGLMDESGERRNLVWNNDMEECVAEIRKLIEKDRKGRGKRK